MTWMLSNVVAKPDAKDNVYPRKERPENKIDGPVALIRWPGAWTTSALKQAVIPDQKLERVLDLPYGYGTDHAEGIALTERSDGGRELMVVYDSPAQGRLSDETAIRADLFAID